MKCPKCGADVPVDPGWVSWCDHCEWGVDTDGASATKRRRAAREQGRANRLGSRMFEDLAARRDLRPGGFGLRRTIAYAIAVVVHCFSLAVLISGLALIVGGWPHLVIIGFGVSMAFFFKERHTRRHAVAAEKEALKAALQSIRLASALETTHQQTMEQLRKKSGQDFDRAYMAYQVEMHQQALKLVEDTADSSDDSRLKQHLIQERPELQSHLSAAQNLQRQLVAQQ